MSNSDLMNIINKIRNFVFNERTKDSNKDIDIFFLNVLEISCSLTELGINQKRSIEKSEEYWFKSGYHMNFWQPNIEQELYSPLVTEVKDRNWFL